MQDQFKIIQKCKIRRRLTWGKQYQYMSVVTVWYAHGAKNRKIAKYIKYLKPPKGDKVVRFVGLRCYGFGGC